MLWLRFTKVLLQLNYATLASHRLSYGPQPTCRPTCKPDFNNGQFSERCDVDGSFFNSNAIPIIFWKGLTAFDANGFGNLMENGKG